MKISVKVSLWLVFVLVQVDGQIPAFGRCPNKYKPMKDFNKYQFMGDD